MSVNITTAFVESFRSGIDHLVQQKGSRLRNAVRVESGVVGKRVALDQIGVSEATQRTVRHGDIQIVDAPHARRWITMREFEWGEWIDQPDKLKVLNDPTNAYSTSAAWAMGRKIDEVIINAAFATATIGEDGDGTEAFDTTNQQVAVGTSNLTVSKLRSAKEKLDAAENDPDEMRFCVVNASALRSLLEETEVTSSDFNTVKALVQGEVNTFLGFNFIRTEKITGAAATKQVIAYRKSALALAIAADSRADISVRKDKSGQPTQVYYWNSIGATRMENKGVVEIVCNQS